MTKSEYDRLIRLDNDLDYQRALERLFQLSAGEDSPLFRHVARVLAGLVVVCVLLGAIVWWQLLHVTRPIHEKAVSDTVAITEEGALDDSSSDGTALHTTNAAARGD